VKRKDNRAVVDSSGSRVQAENGKGNKLDDGRNLGKLSRRAFYRVGMQL